MLNLSQRSMTWFWKLSELWAMNLMNCGNAIAIPCFWTGPYCPHFGCKSDQEKPKDKQQQHNWRCFKRSVHSKAHQRQMTQHFVGLDKREKLDATTKKVLMTYNAQNHQKRKKKKACLELSCIKYNWMKVKWVPIRTLSFSCLRILCPPWN